jgi:hypothetical protein
MERIGQREGKKKRSDYRWKKCETTRSLTYKETTDIPRRGKDGTKITMRDKKSTKTKDGKQS